MTNQERFLKIQERYRNATERRLAVQDNFRRKYGVHNPPGFWLTKGEQGKLDATMRAQDREWDKMFDLLDKVSPRYWRSGVAGWWVMEKLTWEDATTSGALSMIPQAGYGFTVKDSERFAEALA